MGILDKIMFWKKGEPAPGDDFGEPGLGDLDKDIGAGQSDYSSQENLSQTGLTPTQLESEQEQGLASGLPQSKAPEPNLGMEPDVEPMQQPRQFGMPAQQQGFQQQQYQQQYQPQEPTSKDIQIVSSKIDALRSSLELIDHRLENLERVLKEDIERRKRSW